MTQENNHAITQFMLNRRSVLIKNMTEPGPSSDDLETILTIATRVPDHRKLKPWRLLVLQGDARRVFGETLAQVKAQKEAMKEIQVDIEKQCFMRAPLVIAVVASPVEHKTPIEEQILSAGAVCQNINIAAASLGYVSQWVTGWSCLDKAALKAVGLSDDEFIAGYLYIGSCDEKPADRQRPELDEVVTYWEKS
ncbi:nitroreductase [Marinicella sp. S1101]|uniref:nitroreductase family protein n=1 Tax=Marinicella marina TaxID=2996016 RepID=UPI002260E75A|nr:nitroreductase [Marinicella marina]MCX7552834.1 nitroreductase [Marinicella marina]MDJ1139857.1 nitroreductase [Marinicella marina]